MLREPCETERIIIEFMYNEAMYIIGGIYRHPNENKCRSFVNSLVAVLRQTTDRRSSILAGVINIDLVKLLNEDVITYIPTMLPYW